MKVFNKLMMGAAALTLLSGCALFQSKVSYDKFHEKAVEAHEKGHSYKKATANGSVETMGMTVKIDNVKLTYSDGYWTSSDNSVGASVAVGLVNTEAYMVTEDDDSTYYVGGGFKVTMSNEDGKGTAKFNAAGLITSYDVKADNSTMKLTVKYSK